MGCLNSSGQYSHWFANIHLSGPCNRSCYFCIGQHMMALDPLNNLDTFPLLNLNQFITNCKDKNINEINVTGTNTDPLLYKHTSKLKQALLKEIPNLIFGIRTNGVLAMYKPETMELYDKGSITICSFDEKIYAKMMGKGVPPNLELILKTFSHLKHKLKVNVVLGPENTATLDIYNTIKILNDLGISRINVREPYGQPHIGNILNDHYERGFDKLGMPVYKFNNTEITYWDVHYVEVESVNLYANGKISIDYPITRGYSDVGEVKDQSNFVGGRIREQWLNFKKPTSIKKSL